MHLDKYGLPVQADGDANDQCQRTFMILAGICLGGNFKPVEEMAFARSHESAGGLEASSGVYSRYIGGPTDNVSADQLIAALAYWVLTPQKKKAWSMLFQCLKRLGFAQNYKDGLNGNDTKTKLPDFMFFRALPLFARAHRLLYPVAVVADVFLVLLALTAVGPVFRDGSIVPRKRSPDDVDHNNTILTLAVCSARSPTPLSFLARKIFARFCPWNYGCVAEGGINDTSTISPQGKLVFRTFTNNHHPVYGSLRWYHRADAGGNFEIAELWRPICKEYFE
jgi:hypothetical protein